MFVVRVSSVGVISSLVEFLLLLSIRQTVIMPVHLSTVAKWMCKVDVKK